MVIYMKFFMPFLLALFPFLHDQRYPIQLKSCEQDSLIASYEGTPFTLSLFNIGIKDEKGWKKTCELLSSAKSIEMEIDSSVSISEPVAAYVFVDGELLQERLIREEYAYTLIHNPEYTYQESLSALEKSQMTMASPYRQEKEIKRASSGWKFLLLLFLTWLCMILYLIIKIKKIHPFHTRQTL